MLDEGSNVIVRQTVDQEAKIENSLLDCAELIEKNKIPAKEIQIKYFKYS